MLQKINSFLNQVICLRINRFPDPIIKLCQLLSQPKVRTQHATLNLYPFRSKPLQLRVIICFGRYKYSKKKSLSGQLWASALLIQCRNAHDYDQTASAPHAIRC